MQNLWPQVIAQTHMFEYALCAYVDTHRYMCIENKKNSVYNFNNGDDSIYLILIISGTYQSTLLG